MQWFGNLSCHPLEGRTINSVSHDSKWFIGDLNLNLFKVILDVNLFLYFSLSNIVSFFTKLFFQLYLSYTWSTMWNIFLFFQFLLYLLMNKTVSIVHICTILTVLFINKYKRNWKKRNMFHIVLHVYDRYNWKKSLVKKLTMFDKEKYKKRLTSSMTLKRFKFKSPINHLESWLTELIVLPSNGWQLRFPNHCIYMYQMLDAGHDSFNTYKTFWGRY